MISPVITLAFASLASASFLPTIHDFHGNLFKRSQELEVSAEAKALLQDIADNITLTFQSYRPLRLEIRDIPIETSRTLNEDPFLVKRAPVTTASVVTIPGDDPPEGAAWDESIANDNDARAQVKTAWAEAIRLADLAAGSLNQLQQNLQGANLGNDLDRKKNFVAHQSPSMAQQFGSDPDLIQNVHDVFQKIIDNVKDPSKRSGVVLRIALGTNIKRADGRSKVCGAKTGGMVTYAQAFDKNDANNPNDLQKKYIIDDAMIVLCNSFFQHLNDPDKLPLDKDVLASNPSLDKLKTPGQTFVHEWTHLGWIQATNQQGQPDPEVYGFEETAQLMKDNGKDQALNNADSYAVFASYNAYNQEPYAPTDMRPGFGCKDVWPRDGNNNGQYNPAKPGKDTWP